MTKNQLRQINLWINEIKKYGDELKVIDKINCYIDYPEDPADNDMFETQSDIDKLIHYVEDKLMVEILTEEQWLSIFYGSPTFRSHIRDLNNSKQLQLIEQTMHYHRRVWHSDKAKDVASCFYDFIHLCQTNRLELPIEDPYEFRTLNFTAIFKNLNVYTNEDRVLDLKSKLSNAREKLNEIVAKI